MKSYGQLCAVARALDVVGDRWTLLLVRELLIEPTRRFSDLQRGLPGIAPNLLTQRLRDLEEHGVIERSGGGPAGGGRAGSGRVGGGRAGGRRAGEPTAYRLTERGRALDGVIRELLKWGAPTVLEAPRDAIFQMHWLSQPARYLLRDSRPGEPAPVVRFGDLADGFDLTSDLSSESGEVSVAPCDPQAEVAATVTGPGPVLVGTLQGALTLDRALASGVAIDGDPSALARYLPRP